MKQFLKSYVFQLSMMYSILRGRQYCKVQSNVSITASNADIICRLKKGGGFQLDINVIKDEFRSLCLRRHQLVSGCIPTSRPRHHVQQKKSKKFHDVATCWPLRCVANIVTPHLRFTFASWRL